MTDEPIGTRERTNSGSLEMKVLLDDPSYSMGMAMRSAATETLAEVERLRAILKEVKRVANSGVFDHRNPGKAEVLSLARGRIIRAVMGYD